MDIHISNDKCLHTVVIKAAASLCTRTQVSLVPQSAANGFVIADVGERETSDTTSLVRYMGRLSNTYPTDPVHALFVDESLSLLKRILEDDSAVNYALHRLSDEGGFGTRGTVAEACWREAVVSLMDRGAIDLNDNPKLREWLFEVHAAAEGKEDAITTAEEEEEDAITSVEDKKTH